MKLSERLEQMGGKPGFPASTWDDLSAAIEQARRDEYDLARFCNPWTIQIKNHGTGEWEDFCHDAPLTLQNAEQRVKEYQAEHPQAEFRVEPWLNAMQFQHHILPLRKQAREYEKALEAVYRLAEDDDENASERIMAVAQKALEPARAALTGPTGGTQ